VSPLTVLISGNMDLMKLFPDERIYAMTLSKISKLSTSRREFTEFTSFVEIPIPISDLPILT